MAVLNRRAPTRAPLHRSTRYEAGRRADDGGIATSIVTLLADLGVVVALVTAVFYYFGWVRTRYQARELGFDVSALNLGTADYLLKSLNVLFAPLLALVGVLLVLHHLHQRYLLRFARTAAEPRVLRLATLLGRAWMPLAGVAVLLQFTGLSGYAMPLCLLAAVLLAGYGRWIRLVRSDDEPWTVMTKTLLVVLLILATFWTTERFARTMGEAYGKDIVDDPAKLPAVVVYSTGDLGLGSSGTTIESRTGPDAVYKYRYGGLFLLERSGGRYFLITDHPGRVIVLPESGDVRMEFIQLDRRT